MRMRTSWIRPCLAGLAFIGLMGAASAERRAISPMVLHGEWFGTVGSMPASCGDADGVVRGDGYWVVITAGQTALSMSVQPLTAGKVTGDTVTQYTYIDPPANAPERLELFMDAKGHAVGVDVLNASTLEWVPAGQDGGFAQTAIYLRRCTQVRFLP